MANGVRLIDARHVDQRVEPAEAVDDLPNGIFRLVGVGQVGLDRQPCGHRPASTSRNRPFDRRAAGVIGHCDIRAAGGEQERQVAADAPAAGDQDDAARELAVGRIG